MKILIVEDELIIAENLKGYCIQLGYEVVAIASSVIDAIQLLAIHSPNIVLLDINLEGNREGIQIAEYINLHLKIPFIFITAYSDSDTFLSAGKTYPSAYIIKPVDLTTLKINIELAIIKYRNNLHLTMLDSKPKLLKTPKDINEVDFSTCTYIEATQNYLHIYFINNEKCIIRYTISDLEKALERNFIRVHKSYIINLKYVSTVMSGKVNIMGKWIPVGRVFKNNLIEK